MANAAPSNLEHHSTFIWKDFSRFVEVAAVRGGWLVLWGRYLSKGQVRELVGNRIYRDISGARRRVADAIMEMTRDPGLVAEALMLFDRSSLPRPPHDHAINPGQGLPGAH